MARKLQHRMTVDPGLKGTGYAIWRARHWDRSSPPTEVGVIHPQISVGNDLDGMRRSKEIANRLWDLTTGWNCTHVFVEDPAYFDSAGGQMSARRGDLKKLVFLAGMICGRLIYQSQIVRVNDWKGQLPKVVVEARVRSALGDDNCEGYHSHIWDAVGMGLYLKGVINA